jgi:hypothetical protein
MPPVATNIRSGGMVSGFPAAVLSFSFPLGSAGDALCEQPDTVISTEPITAIDLVRYAICTT